jgi:hypothetical protein
MLLTWGGIPERTLYAVRTLDHVLANLKHVGDLHLVIADDGSPPAHLQRLLDVSDQYRDKLAKVHLSNSHGEGYGRNFNNATGVAHEHAEYILPLEDDWELTRGLDTAPLVGALQDERIDCIRLGYLGFTAGFHGDTIHAADQTYLLLDPESPDPHVFSGHPRLETRTWERKVGLWPLELNPGATEWEVAHRKEARRGVVWPLDLIPAKPGAGSLFSHIGTVQARKDQR